MSDAPTPTTRAPHDEDEFRAHARAFLAANATRRVELGAMPAYIPRDPGPDFQARLFIPGLPALPFPPVIPHAAPLVNAASPRTKIISPCMP